ncbi:hypothetical protein ACFSM5_14475 [Lacibacterium aquatile]|uniref:Ankyrin repeat domain-containing protein n=1 Tax=Lacibacterium aquatile TaxID=1168082 RepID=A0ABW5DWB7_9PROT
MRWLRLLLLVWPLAAVAADRPPTADMLEVLRPLEKQLKGLAEQYGNRGIPPYSTAFIETSRTAVRDAAIDFRKYLEDPKNRATLRDQSAEADPLTVAILMGFPDFVEALLAYPKFRADVNKPNRHLETPWIVAILLPAQAWMVCGDGHMMGGTLAFFGYLGFDAERSPYRKVRRLLEEAGATPQPEQARDAWLRNCDPSQFNGTYGPRESSPGVRQRVADAPDIQAAILAELETLARSHGWIRP